MSSKNLKLFRLLIQYNTIMWDIIRAYKESGINEKELVAFLVENNINVSSRTLVAYRKLYDKLKDIGYSDDTIDKKTPSQWQEYVRKKGREDGQR